MDINEQKRAIVQQLVDIYGGKPKFYKYFDEQEKSTVDVLCIENVPKEGVNFYSTIGTFEYPSGSTFEGLPYRVELVGVCDARENTFKNILSTCSFCIINSNYKICAGEIFHDIIEMYHPTIDMKHIMFVPPFIWEEELDVLRFGDKCVDFLLAVPISENECIYAEENGTDALEDLFEEKQLNIFNLQRKSIL